MRYILQFGPAAAFYLFALAAQVSGYVRSNRSCSAQPDKARLFRFGDIESEVEFFTDS
jgi:hypothetical protein